MFDEISTEKHLRWDHLTNHFLGVCQEHAKNISLKFNNEADLEELFSSVESGDMHYASEVST